MKSIITKSLLLPLATLAFFYALSSPAFATSPTITSITSFSLLHTFSGGSLIDGGQPHANLMQGTDGRLYGTAEVGGSAGYGTVFAVNPDGTGFSMLHSFTSNDDGSYPTGGLMQGTDGRLYGTASQGGTSRYGVVFAVNPSGAGFITLHSFTNGNDGAYPSGDLIQGADGRLYGTASQGGASGYAGTVFAVNPDGTGFTILYSFTGGIDGTGPNGLIQGTDGRLYGTAGGRGAYGHGTVFAVNPNGTGFTTLYNFTDGSDGAQPLAGLIQGIDGRLYGTTCDNTTNRFGTAFVINTDGTGFTTLHHFTGGDDGANPFDRLTQGADGRLYGTANLGGPNSAGTVFAVNPDGTGFTILYSFSYNNDGGNPDGGLIQGTDGRLYGTTTNGGTNNSGTLFEISGLSGQSVNAGTNVTLAVAATGTSPLSYQWQFNGVNIAGATSATLALPNISGPNAGAYTAVVSNLEGSATSNALTLTVTVPPTPSAPVFTPAAGTYNAVQLVNITSTNATNIYYTTDGSTPTPSSNLYMGPISIPATATLSAIGFNGSGGFTPVTSGVYTINTPPQITSQPQIKAFSLIHNFGGANEGYNPEASVIQGTDGRLYGTTSSGPNGDETVFAVNPDGAGFTTLASFPGGNSSGNPESGVIQGTDGRLYGTTIGGGATSNGSVFAVSPNGTGFTTLYSFTGGNDGDTPRASLVQASDGRFYGTTSQGGANGWGTIFGVNPDGTGFTTLYTFTGGSDSGFPSGRLIQGADGRLYGTAYQGGTGGFSGTVFAINLDGTGFTTLYTFLNGSDGGGPMAGLVQGTDGRLYGAADYGGANGKGTVFVVNSDGTGFTTLHAFTGRNEGANPSATLIQGTEGRLYGTTTSGGPVGFGTVFAINPDGTGFTTLYIFTDDKDGVYPAGLFQGSDGRLYGTTEVGGLSSSGTLFEIPIPSVTAGNNVTYSVTASGTAPLSYQWQLNGVDVSGATNATLTLTQVNASNAGSYTVVVSNAAGSVTSTATTLTVTIPPPPSAPLFYPAGGTYASVQSVSLASAGATSIYYTTDGSTPTTASTLYTTTVSLSTATTLRAIAVNGGGSSPVTSSAYTINIPPQILSSPSFSLLYAFSGANDGGSPNGLIQGTDGRLYGTASQSGATGNGEVFAVNPDGTGFTAIYSFTGGNDGGNPSGSLIQGTDGRLYGTGANGYGSLFAVNPDGTGFTTIHSFTGGSDGSSPNGLIQGIDGRLFGTAPQGANGYGTVFAVNLDGTGFTTLYSFTGGSDGAYAGAGLIQGSDGRLYGTAGSRGANGYGTVFAINPDGTGFTTLYSFSGGSDGSYPNGNVIQGTDGRLYGTTAAGGANSQGTVFAINPDGTSFTTLYSFTGGNDGAYPQGSLIQRADGRLYGAANGGANNGYGTVFAINSDGTGFTVLYSFTGGSDGGSPDGGLIQGTDGRLFGAANRGGDSNGDGTLFAISSPIVASGTNSTFTVTATGGLPLSYQWQLNGVNITGATGATLTLTNVNASNDGIYTVVVSNPEGSVTSSAAILTVLSPSINSLNPATVAAGSGAFTLTVTGANFANGAVVNWNGSARPTTFVNSTTLTAAIPASDIASTNDLATALITVQSAGGDLSNTAALPIVTPNVAAVQSNAVAAGSSATVSTAPSTGGAAGVTTTLQDNGTASEAVTVADYTANPTGVTYFDVGGGFVDLQVTGATAADTATAYFYYPNTITGTNETNLMLLYFDGSAWQPVLSSGGVAPAKDTTDNLDGTVSGGKFTVTFDNTSTPLITNLVGTVFTMSVPKVKKEHPPHITTEPKSQTAATGANVTFSVTAKSKLPVTYQWSFNGTAIPGATDSTLTLHNVTSANAGDYTVTVTNAAGSKTSHKATLTVLPPPPVITHGPQSQTVNSGENVTFTVTATGTALTYEWSFNGKKIDGAKSSTLTLTKVELSDAGAYSVVVSNDGGSATSTATLTVNAPAINSISPSTVKAGSGAFTLTVTGTGFASGATVKWNSEKMPTTFVSSTVLTAAIPASEIPKKQSGTVSITVDSPSGDHSNAKTLTISL